MPITPRFKLSQSETQLTITLHIPHIRVSASTLEVLVDGSEFHFYSSPYLLHLSFPGRLLDDAETCREAKATYDPSDQNGMLTIVIWKAEEGIWPDLDLLSNLINRSPPPSGVPRAKISVIASTSTSNSNGNGNGKQELNKEGDDISTTDDGNLNHYGVGMDLKACLKPHYGFLNLHHSVFTDYAREGLSHDMLEIPSPDDTPSEDRRNMRLDVEIDKFDSDRYLADLFLSDDPEDESADMIYVEAGHFTPHWTKKNSVDDLTSQMKQLDTSESGQDSSSTSQGNFFTEDESLRLISTKAQLPALSKINKEQTQSLFYSLVDILYAYAYDHRTTTGDPTCESSWTVVMLSPTLSWLECYTPPYDNITHVLRWCIRRALIYPYLRTFEFVAGLLVNDVVEILRGGRRIILRCLLQIQEIMDGSEFHYLFNKLFINSYICWIQQINDDALVHFVEEDLVKSLWKDGETIGGSFLLDKSSLGLDLDLLEKYAFEDSSSSDSSSCSCESEDDDSETSVGSSSQEEDGADDDGKGGNCNSSGDEVQPADQQNTIEEKPSKNLLDNQIGSGNILSLDAPLRVHGGDRELVEKDNMEISKTPAAQRDAKKSLITEIG